MDVILATSHSYLAIVPQWCKISNADLNSLWNLPLYIRPPIIIAGVLIPQPRDVAFFSNESVGYYYSGQLMPSQPLTTALISIMNDVNEYLGTNFNGVLANRYNDGNDTLGAHSDSAVGLDKEKSCVAGISFGAVRNFRIRYKKNKSKIKSKDDSNSTAPKDLIVATGYDRSSPSSTIIADIPQQEGMLLVMAGEFQEEFTHEIPASTTVATPRLSLTFRHHQN